MIEQRDPNFQGVCHARPVNFRENVSGQIGFHIQILNQRQRMPGRRRFGMMAQYLDRLIALQAAFELAAEHPIPTQASRKQRNRMEVTFDRVTAGLEGGLGTKGFGAQSALG